MWFSANRIFRVIVAGLMVLSSLSMEYAPIGVNFRARSNESTQFFIQRITFEISRESHEGSLKRI